MVIALQHWNGRLHQDLSGIHGFVDQMHGAATQLHTGRQGLADRIHELDASAGVTVNPDTPANLLRPAIPHVDLVLVMTVQAGFGGQKFMPEVVPKIRQVKSWLAPAQRLEVDGGIEEPTAALTAVAGADTFVAGTAIFRRPDQDYAAAIRGLRRAAGRPTA